MKSIKELIEEAKITPEKKMVAELNEPLLLVARVVGSPLTVEVMDLALETGWNMGVQHGAGIALQMIKERIAADNKEKRDANRVSGSGGRDAGQPEQSVPPEGGAI